MQLLAWIGSALQVSNTERIQLRSSRIRFYGGNKFDLTFANTDLHETEQSCWYALFSNPVIAHAWPIPGRDNDEIGLDITVRLMAALAGATHAFDFEGGFVLKGFSAMLVPIKSYSNSTQWHLIQNEKGGHIDYAEVRSQCPERALLAEVNLESLLSKRAFLGWWKAADTLLGTADVAYAEIAYSGVKPPGRSAKISGASLGFSQYLSGAATFGFGRKDGRLHISRTGGLKQILDYAEEVPVCLYDSVGKRGWLGAATDALLHIACAKQKEKAFVIDNVPISFTYADPHSHGHKASRNAMTKMKSLILEVGGKTGGGDFCFGDLIEELWAVLDRLGAESSVVEDAPGITVKLTLEGKLQGWELMDLVRPVSDFCPRKTVLRATHGGWSDLIPDISAIVLFASGLGEVIRPRVEDKGLCALWRTMPKGKDYLAASIPILEKLHKRTGPPKNHKYMLSHRLCWHSPSIIFESCAESKRSNSCTCYRLQELIPDSFTTVGNIKAPYTPLVQEGCVIFGRAEHPLVRALRERRNKKTTANGIFKQPNKVFLEEPREPSSPSSTSSEGSHFPKILSPDDGKHHEPSCRNVSRRQGLRSTTTTAVLENRRKRQRSKEFELTKEEESSLSETSLAYSQQRPQCRHMSKNKIPRLRQAGRASTNREEKSNVYVSSNLLPRQQGNSNLGLQKPAPKLRRRGSAYDLHGSAQENYSNHECFASESRPEGNMVNESFNLKNKGEIELVRLNVSAKEKRS